MSPSQPTATHAISPAILILLLLASLAGLLGCTVQLISSYDDVLDKDVTALQEKTETFLNQMEADAGTPAAAYSANRDFYIKSSASLRTMATRAVSQPKSKIVVEQVESLQKTFDDMQQLHKLDGDKGLTPANLANIRSAMESEFTSILTLQLALKSHTTVPNSATAPAKK